MTTFMAFKRLWGAGPAWSSTRLVITTRTSWMANNAIPDSITMNMICWSLGPPVELNEPNVFSTEVILTSKNTMRILNTIKPVTRAFTTMDEAKPVRASVSPQLALKNLSSSINVAPPDVTQVARGYELKSAFQNEKINWLTNVCDCQEWRNNHDPDIFTPHDPTTVDLWRFRWIRQMIGTTWFTMCTNVHWAIKSQQPFNVSWTIERRNDVDCESIWSWTGSVLTRNCITDKKIWYFHR